MNLPRERVLNVAGVLAVVALWSWAVPPGHPFLPPLGEVVADLIELVRSRVLPRDAAASIGRVVPGVASAFAAAALLTLVTGVWRSLGHLVEGILEVLRPVPPIAWVPLAILVFGIGDAPAVAIVGLGAFFPIWFGMQQGLGEVRDQHVLTAQSFGASRRLLLTDVVVPSMVPYVLHGLRLAVGLGWFCVVAAEMMGAQSGLGYGVQLFSLNLELSRVYCYILAIGALGAVLNYGMRWVEGRACRWHRLSVQGFE